MRLLAALLTLLPVGHSAQGRLLEPVVLGSPDAAQRVLVVGCIHGTERAGLAVTRRIVAGGAPADVELVVLPALNADGCAHRTRWNAHGVDLNRNFPSLWSPLGRRGREWAGPHAASEPETRYAMRLIAALRPQITIWFHQPEDVVRAWGASVPTARRLAALAAFPYRSIRWPHGSATNWQNHRFPGTASLVVELPAGRLPAARVARWARAIRALAVEGVRHR